MLQGHDRWQRSDESLVTIAKRCAHTLTEGDRRREVREAPDADASRAAEVTAAMRRLAIGPPGVSLLAASAPCCEAATDRWGLD